MCRRATLSFPCLGAPGSSQQTSTFGSGHVDDGLGGHFSDVTGAILEGDVVPVLGAGVNLCDRSKGQPWEQGRCLPDSRELADMLASKFAADSIDRDLARVSEAAILRRGADPLFRQLRNVFVGDYEPTSVHRFLAGLPALRERRGLPPCPQLIMTTNYDSLLERAFTEAGRPFDVVYYLGDGGHRKRSHGKFMHVDAQDRQQEVETPNTYCDARIDERTVIFQDP